MHQLDFRIAMGPEAAVSSHFLHSRIEGLLYNSHSPVSLWSVGGKGG